MRHKQIIAALGIIINDEGQFLITLRNDPDNPRAHHKWEIPGGGVEDGETFEQAVIREVKEEIGVVIELLPYPSINVPVAIQDPHNLERKKLDYLSKTDIMCEKATQLLKQNVIADY